METENKNWLKTLWDKYNQLCKELGVDNGACRSCVPVVKFDPEQPQKATSTQEKK